MSISKSIFPRMRSNVIECRLRTLSFNYEFCIFELGNAHMHNYRGPCFFSVLSEGPFYFLDGCSGREQCLTEWKTSTLQFCGFKCINV